MKKFWMIGLLALASANSFQTTRATADNTIYKPIFDKLNVARLPRGDITKAMQALETPPQGGQSNQTQTSDSQKNTDLITALKKINEWDDRISTKVPSNKKIVDYLSNLGEVASKLNQVTRRPELNPIEQHIITIKKEIRGKDITSSEFGQITGTKNIRLIPLKFFNNGQIFASETLKKATVFELEQAMLDVGSIGEESRDIVNKLTEEIKETKTTESKGIDSSFTKEDLQKIEEAVNKVINNQSAGGVQKSQTAETNQKKEPEQKTPSRRQRRLANQNKGDKKGKKKSFWKKLRFWKWFRKKKKNKMNQTAAAPKRRLRSFKPTVTVTDVPAKNNPKAKKQAGANNNQQQLPSSYKV